MTIFQNEGSCNVWRLDTSELKFISPFLRKIYQNFSIDYTQNKTLTDDDILNFYELDKKNNTSEIAVIYYTVIRAPIKFQIVFFNLVLAGKVYNFV